MAFRWGQWWSGLLAPGRYSSDSEKEEQPVEGFKPADQREADLLAALHPWFKDKVEQTLTKCRAAGLMVYIFEGERTWDRQKELYAKGRNAAGVVIDKKSVVTNAKPGTSFHNYAVAVDLVFDGDTAKPGIQWSWSAPAAKWAQMGKIAQECGLEWAGAWKTFPEFPHSQLPSSIITWQEMQAIYLKGGKAAVWAEIDSRLAA